MKKEIREGEILPKGYGLAWYEMDRLVGIAYPIPLNIIFGFIRKIWFRLKSGDLYVTGYDKGYLKGHEEGRNYVFNKFKKLIKIEKKLEIIDKK